METVFVQLDPTLTVIIGYMGSPQDPEVFPNQMEMTVDDPRYIAWYDSQPFYIQWSLPTPVRG